MNWQKKIRSLLMLLIILTTVITSEVHVGAVQSVYSTDLGTNAALGSPLLNASFETADWNPYEMVVFGIFLSNYCINWGEDNYESAFSQNSSEGLRGKGLQALVFGTGSDSVGTQALQSMLLYAIKAQKQERHQIYVRYKYKKNLISEQKSGDYINEAYTEATGKSMLFLSNENTDGFLEKSSEYYSYLGKRPNDINTSLTVEGMQNFNFITAHGVDEIFKFNGMSFYYSDFDIDVELSIKGAEGQYVKIFDSADGWDSQQYADYAVQGWQTGANRNDEAWFSSIVSAKLFLDCFGNICCDTSRLEAAVLFPAACNQYLTQNKSHNYVTIGTVNDYYTKASANDLVSSSDWMSGGTGTLYFNDSTLNVGERIVGFDTNSAIGNMVNTNENGVIRFGHDGAESGSEVTLNTQWGQVITNILQADINTEGAALLPATTFLVSGEMEEKVGSNFFTRLITGGQSTSISVFWSQAESVIASRYLLDLSDTSPKKLTSIWTPDGELSIFDSPVYVSPAANPDVNKVLNNVFQYLDGKHGVGKNATTVGVLDPAEYIAQLKTFNDVDTVVSQLFIDSTGIKPLLENSIKNVTNYTVTGGAVNETVFFGESFIKNGLLRIVKLYPRSATMNEILNDFTAKEGSNFDYLTPYIYTTYLQWYGVIGTDAEEVNDSIFQASSDLLNTTGEDLFSDIFLTEEEKKSNVLDYTYLLLNPNSEQAKEYKRGLFRTTIASLLYDEYKSITNSDSSSTGTNSGFLRIPSLSENWLTAWLVNGYVKVVIGLIGIFALVIVIFAIITRKKFYWVFLSLGTVVIVFLLLPNLAEVTPYLCEQIVQNTFDNNMDYWAISESTSNLVNEDTQKKAIALNSSDSSTLAETLLVNSMKNRLYTVVTDNALMFKNDISTKVNQDLDGLDSEIQQLASARWLMPILMQQYSSNDESANYLYTSLNSFYVDSQNLYWYYAPIAKVSSKTLNSALNTIVSTADSEYGSSSTIIESDSLKTTAYSDYIDVVAKHPNLDANIERDSYFLSLTRSVDSRYVTHAGFYLVDFNLLGYAGTGLDKEGIDDTARLNLREAESKMETLASTYDPEQGTPQCYGYLLSTMNPGYYFYMLVRDTCNGMILTSDQILKTLSGDTSTDISPTSLTSLVGSLQGTITGYIDTSEARDGSQLVNIDDLPEDADYSDADIIYKRNSFMHADGYIIDFLDMEELFTNMIPYLYDMYNVAAGDTYDEATGQQMYTVVRNSLDTSGKLVQNTDTKFTSLFQPDETMENYPLYKDNARSWFWRCNWVIKLVESKDLTRETKVSGRDDEGRKKTYTLVGSPLDPRSYPVERPMVFSEAQMVQQGLTRSDLTVPELKILKVNADVEQKWTYLLNYANTSGVSEEVFYRQMAVIALLSFNKEFDTSRMFNVSKALYPQTIDLRNLSFDSVIKLLMINCTKDINYMQTDVIGTIINDGNMLTTYTLLAGAYICNIIVPAIREIFLGLLFFLLIWIVITNLFSSLEVKKNILCGYLISNGLFALINILYFGVFRLLIQISSIDTVLTIESVTSVQVSPAIVFLILVLAGGLNIAATIFLGILIFKNRKDLGFTKYMFLGKYLTSKIGEKFSSAANSLKSRFSGVSTDSDAVGSKTSDTAKTKKGRNNNYANTGGESPLQSGSSEEAIVLREDPNSRLYDEESDYQMPSMSSNNALNSDLMSNDKTAKSDEITNKIDQQIDASKRDRETKSSGSTHKESKTEIPVEVQTSQGSKPF